MAKVLLLDGNSLTYRAFFALPTDMTTASGQVTNAVYGFTSMLVNLFKDHHPDAIVVTFDRPEPTFRHAFVPEYKAQREAAPDILRQQMGLVQQVLEVLAIPTVSLASYEADDLIATLATQARDNGNDVIIVTGDRDTYQLVEDPHVKVLYNRRGVSDYVLYDEKGILEKTGVIPTLYPQYAALRGDPSDNLPGVPGVGEKTAAKLLNEYGSLENLYEHLDALSPKLSQNLAAAKPQVEINAKATPLMRDVPLDFVIKPNDFAAFDREAARELFTFLEFRTLWDRLLEQVGGDSESVKQELEVAVSTVDTPTEALNVLDAALGAHGAIAPAWISGERYRLSGVAIVHADSPEKAHYVPVGVLDGEVADRFAQLLTGPEPIISVHDAKALMHALEPKNIVFTNLAIDTRVAAYLIDPSESDYPLGEVFERYCHMTLPETAAPATGQLDFAERDPAVEAATQAAATAYVAKRLSHELDERGLTSLYETIERPLIHVLARMEILGIAVDIDYLRELASELASEASMLEKEIQDIAGEPINVNSSAQLRVVLFEKLGLTPQKKTKTGYSTDAATLERLRDEHPIVEKLLRYREVEKLRSTYGESLIHEVASDGRIHATFNQTVARTGRLSSDRPNLHNIPVRTEEGRRFRRAFVPKPGCHLLIADYNQIELRVIAHLADDPGLVAAFTEASDVHRETAARVFGVLPEDVTFEQRSKAKMVSYGLAYGMEAYGLSQRLNIGVDEASKILNAYFDAFPNIKSYMEQTVADARKRGYTETLFGRRRPIPELNSDNFRVRQAGERQAMNAGIQGLAADIFKVALIRTDNALSAVGLDARIVLQVHDEIVVEVPDSEQETATEAVLGAMREACALRVPLEVNSAWVTTWADAK